MSSSDTFPPDWKERHAALRQRFQERMRAKEAVSPPLVSPVAPRYDEVFQEGLRALEFLNEDPSPALPEGPLFLEIVWDEGVCFEE